MPTTAVGNDDASGTEPGRTADLKPHAVLIPVPELDRAKDSTVAADGESGSHHLTSSRSRRRATDLPGCATQPTSSATV
jgi:hypothetical protein